MAYSSWVSDLKTRSSVGFLGKVVNLLVQAKDRVDAVHTTATANTATGAANTAEADLRTKRIYTIAEYSASSATVSTTTPFGSITTTGDDLALSLAAGSTNGALISLIHTTDGGGDATLTAASNSIYNPTDGSDALRTTIVFDTVGDRVDLMWTSTNSKWLVIYQSGVAFGG